MNLLRRKADIKTPLHWPPPSNVFLKSPIDVSSFSKRWSKASSPVRMPYSCKEPDPTRPILVDVSLFNLQFLLPNLSSNRNILELQSISAIYSAILNRGYTSNGTWGLSRCIDHPSDAYIPLYFRSGVTKPLLVLFEAKYRFLLCFQILFGGIPCMERFTTFFCRLVFQVKQFTHVCVRVDSPPPSTINNHKHCQ